MATPNEIELSADPDPQTIPNPEDELSWKKLSEYTTIVQNLSGRISNLQKLAFTLANYYFVSQAVVFTALSSNSSLVCRNVWFPLFLSLLPGALNLFAFFKIGQEYIKTMIWQKVYKKLRRDHGVLMAGQRLQQLLTDEDNKNVEKEEKKRLTRNLYISMCAVGFLAVVTAVGSLWMLCGESSIVKHKAKCVKLCTYFSICCFAIVLKIMATSDIETGDIKTLARQTNTNAGDELSWTRLSEHQTIVQNLSGQISSLQTSAFTVASSYFISQAVIFTALSTTNSLVCCDFWFPLLLSLFPGALNLFTFFKIGQEYIETTISQKKFKELRTNHEVHMRRTNLIPISDANNWEETEKVRLTRNLCRYMYAFVLLAAVVDSGILWMLCWESFYAFGPLAAVVDS
ncbi:hypothetical protein RHSIM_Rhsim02G0190400 [Rhododendron simsii]|uniref:Uncharacterized protein n=1 Tax=Rhododendron simsii TaxID=118357 RepID=A0A834LUJ7_RHOSS|nr:hypothetical protein RHSIM_Rhsim02G0190400 [Rhododendron simsii]